MQARHDEAPLAVDRRHRQAHRRGDLFAIEACEITQRDDPGLAWIFRAESLECLVQGRNILDRRDQRPVEVLPINTLFTAPTL